MKMALFILIFIILNYFVTSLLGSEDISNKTLEIKPSTITSGQNVGFYKVDDTLNLTCTFKNDSISQDVVIEWVVPNKSSNSQNRVINQSGANYKILIIGNLEENDSGVYRCRAVYNGNHFFTLESSIKINVKNKKKECPEAMFQCAPGMCISKRYTCDGLVDCPQGEDESPIHCGLGNPCEDKLKCPDKRCIPFTWCCESHKEPNCTTKVKHSCCSHVEKLTRDVDNDLGYQYEQQRFSDMGFLQTTVYTVIGCAMAFMFIVTIIVIAICRVHVRRTLLSRCPAVNRSLVLGRGGNIHGNHLNELSFYDLDLYFNRPNLSGGDLMSVNPLLVTYNINNGVQIVGRPVDPPPYCEIVTSPPKEGPPPPYTSHENLSENRSGVKPEELLTESIKDAEMTESDALLGGARQNVNVISCDAIDVVPSEETTPLESASINDDNAECVVNSENNLKEESEDSNSSHYFADKAVGGSKNSGLDAIVVGKSESVICCSPRNEKLHNGESCSYSNGNVSDISRGAVKKIIRANTQEGSCRWKGKCHSKKF